LSWIFDVQKQLFCLDPGPENIFFLKLKTKRKKGTGTAKAHTSLILTNYPRSFNSFQAQN